MKPNEYWPRWNSGPIRLATTDASKVILANPGSPLDPILVRYLQVIIVTAAAQAITVRDESSTKILLVIPASAAAGTKFELGPFDEGIRLTAGDDLVIAPAAVGPACDVIADGYYGGATA